MKLFPLYSSHSDGRKTHIANEDGESLCGIEQRFPELLFGVGDEIKLKIEDWAGHNADGNCCRRCLRVASQSARSTQP